MNERIVAVIPIRSLRNGKTRLASALGPEAREALLRRAAARVVDAARDSGTIETTVIVSPDPETLSWAATLGLGVVGLPQPEEHPGLNGAIDAGRAWALDAGAAAMLSLFADLPLLTPEDVQTLSARSEALVLGSDRRGEGTNALLLRLAGAGATFQFAFGEGSFARHLDEARRLGLYVAVHTTLGIGFDLDTPDDWTDFRAVAGEAVSPCEPVLAKCGAGLE
ncbi:MAG: 2-phospho-L-lactate guanylyltransferase [Thermomicrobiales bacterium]